MGELEFIMLMFNLKELGVREIYLNGGLKLWWPINTENYNFGKGSYGYRHEELLPDINYRIKVEEALAKTRTKRIDLYPQENNRCPAQDLPHLTNDLL